MTPTLICTRLASFIDSSATIDTRSIRFGSGTLFEKLLQVPIAAAGELDAHASIRVTVGLTPVSGDSDEYNVLVLIRELLTFL